MFNYLLQTFRYRNLILICTAAALSFVDSQARLLVDVYIECNGDVDHVHKTNRVRWMNLQFNPRTGKQYFKCPTNNKIPNVKFQFLIVSMPSKKLIEEYDYKKDVFNNEFGKGLIEEARELETRVMSVPEVISHLNSVGFSKILVTNAKNKKVINTRLLSHEYHLNSYNSEMVKRILERDYSDKIQSS